MCDWLLQLMCCLQADEWDSCWQDGSQLWELIYAEHQDDCLLGDPVKADRPLLLRNIQSNR